jgi:hypothetical protein
MSMTKAATLTLHIGTEKTGTSTLQNLLLKNQPALQASGLLYPKSIFMPTMRTHLGLVFYATGANSAMKKGRETLGKDDIEAYNSTLISKLQAEIAAAGCPHVLMSSEHISSRLRKPSDVKRLMAGLGQLADSINMVVYIRPQYDLYASQYSTKIKGGNMKPPRAPNPLRDHVFNYDSMLKVWEQAPHISSVKVRLFDRAHFKDGDLIADFFETIGVEMPPDLVRPPRELNQRLDVSALEFLRTINQLDVDAARHTPQRRQMVKLLGQISKPSSLAMPAAILQQIDDMYRDTNALVAARYFPDIVGPLFPPFVADKGDPPQGLTVAQAVEIGARLLQARDQNMKSGKKREKAPGVDPVSIAATHQT